MSKLRARLTYANVVATLALFVALGGSSYAAITITGKNVPKNALTGADIRSLTGKDVRNNSLTGADVKNLTSGDVTDGRLLAEDFAAGQLPRGEKGDRGDTGDEGPPGPLRDRLRREGVATVGGGTIGNNIWNHNSATATCMPGEDLISGSAVWDNEAGGDPMAIVEVDPDFATNSVTVKGATDVATNRTLRAIAICLAP